MTVTRAPLTPEQRRTILQQQIVGYVRSGYQVVTQSDTDAQLVKPKRFSFPVGCVLFLVGWIFLWIPLFIYIIFYWSSDDERAYLIVDEWGGVGWNKMPRRVTPAGERKPSPSTIFPGLPDNIVLGVASGALLLALCLGVILVVYVTGGA